MVKQPSVFDVIKKAALIIKVCQIILGYFDFTYDWFEPNNLMMY